MCYLCIKDDPFRATGDTTSLAHKRYRAIELKQLLREAEEYHLCADGDETIERLRAEQYRISRDL